MNTLDGHRLKAALIAATRCLQRYSHAINALNVFPVPDGDTGTNMLLTMQSVDERLQSVDTPSLSTVAQEAARGALFGARGNSGVIFSQFLAGFAQGLENVESADPDALAGALASGSQASYAAVSQPVEGTMLTVLRGFAEGAADRSDDEDVLHLWNSALHEAKDTLALTPTMLPVLRDAGVIDSGGQGVVVIMEGFLCSFLDEDPEHYDIELSSPTTAIADMPIVSQDFLDATQSEEYGFCTEFLIEGENIDLTALRAYLSEKGTSLIVIGDSSLAKVHVHTLEPDELIAHGATLGTTTGVKVDDISKQHQGFLSLHGQQQEAAPALAVVAVAWGEGFISLFDDLGCHAIVPCQRTMNPSAQELLEAAKATGAENVVILPNNSNVILTARQAAEIAGETLRFIPTRSQTQGISALLSYAPELPQDQVLQAMEDSIHDVQTVEVTTAHRDTIMDGQSVRSGQVIGLLDGDLTTTGDEVQDVAHRAVLAANPGSGAVVTLYWGGDVQESQARTAARRLEDAIPGVEVETVFGGQPFYHYIASIE